MKTGLLPLNALRAFEAAARHKSFVKAAEELNVTPAAVSHQVKGLEDTLGVTLFQRLPRGLEITKPGSVARPLLTEGLSKMAEAVERMRETEEAGPMTVSTAVSFGVWLVPRLDEFRELCPDIDLLLDVSDRVVDFDRDGVDAAIRFGNGNYPGMFVEPLPREREYPVCSPELLEGPHPLRTPEDLVHHRLIHIAWWGEEEPWPTRKMWLRAAGIDSVDYKKGPRFKQSLTALQVAKSGQGVALASTLLAADDLKAGWLVRPFDLSVAAPDEFGLFFVCPERGVDKPKVAAFRQWIKKVTEEAFAGD